MTIKEYIQMEFEAFGIEDAQIFEVLSSSSLCWEDECIPENLMERQNMCLDILEGLLFRPRLKTINESGISLTYDFDGIGKWYLFLCRKVGRNPNEDIVGMLGVSAITDKTNIW